MCKGSDYGSAFIYAYVYVLTFDSRLCMHRTITAFAVKINEYLIPVEIYTCIHMYSGAAARRPLASDSANCNYEK